MNTKRVIMAFLLLVLLAGCNSSLPSKPIVESPGNSDDSNATTAPVESGSAINRLRLETEKKDGLGNSVSNLHYLGLIVGDFRQLYTVEYWEKDTTENRAGMQIYVSDEAGKRCLTNENDIVGYLNLTDTTLYYVNGRGISMIERSTEAVQEVIAMEAISFLLLAENCLYYIAEETLYEYNLEKQSQREIATGVWEGYLDYEDKQLFFCADLDIENLSASFCRIKNDKVAEVVAPIDLSRILPYKMIDGNTLLCAEKDSSSSEIQDRYKLVLLTLENNTTHVLIDNVTIGSFVQNGNQVIVGTGLNEVNKRWLIHLDNKEAEEIPTWGEGTLNFTANRLFAVNIIDVSHKELTIEKDQFFSKPLN